MEEIIAKIEAICQEQIPHYEERVQWALDLIEESHYPLAMADPVLNGKIESKIEDYCIDHDLDRDELDITPEDIFWYCE